MKLLELEPRFLRYIRTADGGVHLFWMPSLALAQGVSFLCPKCFQKNGGPIGTHSVICWSKSRGVPDDALPGPGRWTLEGTGLHDLTLGCEPGKSRSVALLSNCWEGQDGAGWHGFVTGGDVT